MEMDCDLTYDKWDKNRTVVPWIQQTFHVQPNLVGGELIEVVTGKRLFIPLAFQSYRVR